MPISKKLLRLTFNSYFSSSFLLIIITGIVMLLGMVGCDACKKSTTGEQIATALQVTLTPSQLECPKREAVLNVATKGEKNEVARLKDFDVNVKVGATGKTLGNSKVEVTEYDTSGKGKPRTIQLADSKAEEVITGPLYKYLIGREDATLDYGEEGTVGLKFVPDMGSAVEGMEIEVIITNSKTNPTTFKSTTTTKWNRSPYEFKITGLGTDESITNNKCTLQVTRKVGGVPMTLPELSNLKIGVTQVPNAPEDPHFNEATESVGGAGDRVVTFSSDDLQDGKISKELTLNPGTSGKETTFTLVLTSAGNKDPEALAIAKYTPAAVIPYTLEVNKPQLIGPTDKDFVLTVRDAAGQDLDAEKLKNLKLKVKRMQGQKAKIDFDPAGNEDFEFALKDANELTLSGDKKEATKSLTLDLGTDPQAAVECVLVDSSDEAVADQQVNVQWEIGIKVEITYDDKASEFKYTLTNKTAQKITQLNSECEVVNGVGVQLGNKAKTNGKKFDINANSDVKDNLKMNWHGTTEATIKLTITTAEGVVIYQQDHSIVAHPPHLSITLENGPGPFKVGGDDVKLKIKADEDVDKKELQLAKFHYTSSNDAELTIGGQNPQDKNIQELLALGGEGNLNKLLKNAEHTLPFTITPKNLSGGSFTGLHLENNYVDTTKPNIIAKIDWVGETKVTMNPAEPLKIISGDVLVADGDKRFKMIFKNDSKFPLEEAQLKNVQLSIDPTNPNEPNQVLCNKFDLMAGAHTLWDVCQEMGMVELQPGEEIKIPFTIAGAKNLMEFAMKLTIGAAETTQQVKWGSEYANQLKIVDKKLFINKLKEKAPIEVEFVIENMSGTQLDATALGKISIGFGQPNDQLGTVKPNDQKLNKSYSALVLENIKIKVSFGKIEWSGNVPVTLAQILKDQGKDSLDKDEKRPIKFSVIPQPTDTEVKKEFCIVLLDDQGVVIDQEEIVER